MGEALVFGDKHCRFDHAGVILEFFLKVVLVDTQK
jgi:hypothetical protein